MSTSTPPNSTDRRPPDANRVRIFDTTLRDGEQSPGASMNMAEKLEMARALAALGVDIIEAGFPIASVGDFEAVRAIAAEVTGSSVCGLARCNDRDIDRAWEAIQFAQKPRIHVFLATSAIHREHKLRMTKAQIIEKAVASVRRAKGYCPDIEFSPEDAARTELDFLCEVVEAAIEAGATTVNIPDTVGYATPLQYAHGHPHAQGARAQHRPGDHQHPLPRRPGPGGRQQPGRLRGRRPAGRVHDQRHRRARRQRRARRDRHGPEDPVRLLRPDDRHQDRAALPDQPDALDDHRAGRPAQQGDRGPQRLRPRVRHPPGRHAQGALDLRDHAARGRRRAADRPGPGQALRPPRPARARRRDGLHA